MAEYRAFLVDRDGHFKKVQTLDCADDATALEQAQQLTDSHDVEVWQQARRVGMIKRTPLTA